MNETPEIQEDLGGGGKFKNWLQDNIRIILSVLIVVAIASGIYSYSKRAEVPMNEEEIAMEEVGDEKGAITIVGEESESQKEEMKKEEQQQPPQQETAPQQQEVNEDVKVTSGGEQATVSEETADSFIEVAAAGDSLTTLSRKALRNYLEKNSDSGLTKEHKIYIEDYLRKNVNHDGTVAIGEQVTFSKMMIKDAIEKSKTLNENQLENLKQFSARVSNI